MQDTFDITRPLNKLLSVQQKLESLTTTPPEENELYRDATFFDDVTGTELDKEEAIKARREEMQFFKKLSVYTKVQKEAHMKIIPAKLIYIYIYI